MSSKGRQYRGDFPNIADGFVGRGPELDRIRTLLGSARLITLLGMGGIGKTRLAAEAVGQFRKATRTPVHWVRLARLAKGAGRIAVEEEVAHAVLDADFSGRSVWDTLVDRLAGKNAVGRDLPTVVVMDNCEHVLIGAASLIEALLDAVPGLVVLATSREPVGWVDEHLIEVPPLSPQQALTLFRRRAELTGHTVTHKDQVATAERICRHMHNNPLYIRLAAARLRRQPLEAILRELNGGASDRRMRWSRAWRTGTDTRHERISDVIAWSYDLCTDKERLLLARMSVFAAGSEILRVVRDSLGYDPSPENGGHFGFDVGADLEAIEAVCADDGEHARDAAVSVAKEEIEGLLERLVDQSLVSQHRTETSVRYALLETIRVFARQQLREYSTSGVDEPARVGRRHRQYYRNKVLQAYAIWYGPAELEQLEWVRASWDNILVAIEGSLTTPEESVLGVEISVGLMALRAPWFNGSLRETRQWAERTLEASRTHATRPTELHTVAMALIGWLALWQGQRADTERILQDCIAACTDDPAIRRDWRRNPDIDLGLPAPFELVWGQELMVMHRDPASITVLARAREKSRDLGDRGAEAMGRLLEAMATGFFGSAEQALTLARRNVDDFAAAGALWLKSWAEMILALALTKHGDPTTALSVGRTALTHLVSVRDHWGAALAVHIRCWSLARIITDSIAAGGTDKDGLVALATETARLVGGARALRAEVGTNIEGLGPFADETDKAIDTARGVLGPEAFAAIEKEGVALRPEKGEVQRLALGTLPMGRTPAGGNARTGTRHRWDELTRAEQEVATFAAAGWTNTAIAVRRGSSGRTVDAQMAAIFHKLMITSRKEIVPFVPEGMIDEVRPRTEHRQRHSGERHYRSRRE
ncbi:ATP-binding protein [Nocardia brevicatena]|uniref:ATP-binding protein n=1 Tax=Nocardia brevicatena TaxID=37327 RepID=UPI001C3F4975|nr:LuxR C-terminal-related transcriptional regulator [Nocardia brevicatena]